jgi:hypothetical protein
MKFIHIAAESTYLDFVLVSSLHGFKPPVVVAHQIAVIRAQTSCVNIFHVKYWHGLRKILKNNNVNLEFIPQKLFSFTLDA